MEIADRLKEFLDEKIMNESLEMQLTKDSNLIENGIIDSIGVMKLLTFIEDTYAITIGHDEMIPENFETITATFGFFSEKEAFYFIIKNNVG